jgi:hypothetical protein
MRESEARSGTCSSPLEVRRCDGAKRVKCSRCGTELPAIAGACWSCGEVVARPEVKVGAPVADGDSTPAVAGPSAYTSASSGDDVTSSAANADVGRVLPSNRDKFGPSDRPDSQLPGMRALAPRPSDDLDPGTMTVGTMYLRAFRAIGRGFVVLVAGGLLAFAADVAVTWTVSRVLTYLGQADQSAAGTLANGLTYFLVGAPLSVGWQYLCLRAVRGEATSVADVFVPYRGRLFDTAMASLVQGLLIALASVPLMVAFAAVVLLGVVPATVQTLPEFEGAIMALPTGVQLGLIAGMLAGLLPPLVVAARLSLVPYLVIDEREGPLVAAAESWTRTRGAARMIIGVMLSGVLLSILGVFAFVVGAGVGLMIYSLAHAAVFETVTTRAARARIAQRTVDVYG